MYNFAFGCTVIGRSGRSQISRDVQAWVGGLLFPRLFWPIRGPTPARIQWHSKDVRYNSSRAIQWFLLPWASPFTSAANQRFGKPPRLSLFCRLFKCFLNGQFGDAQRKRPARKALIYPMNQKAVGCQLNDLDRRQQMAPKAEAPGDIFFFSRPHSSGRRPTERSKVVRSDKSRTFVPCADVLV